MKYTKRIIDIIMEEKLETFGGVLITGPKSCGKTTTAKQFAASSIEFQDEDRRDQLLAVAETRPSLLLKGKKPILFDEWKDAPKIWGTVRKAIDDDMEIGAYILTGSSASKVKTPHTGTGRISRLNMLPMSLYESGESNGSVSLLELFTDPDSFSECVSDLTIEQLIYAICRGGWPRAVLHPVEKSRLRIAPDLFTQSYEEDIQKISDVERNPDIAKVLLRSYSRNLCTETKLKNVYQDAQVDGYPTERTLSGYLDDFKKLNIIEDIDAWCPAIRSKTAIRSSPKLNLVDPSIAVAALGLSPGYFNRDFKTLGFLFECLAIRDLKVYSTAAHGKVSYYRDRYGLEADCVLSLEDGRYALIEFKLGEREVDRGAQHLCQIESLIKEKNEVEQQCPIRLPDLKIVITGTKYGYRREDGVLVIPIGCLKN